MTSKYRRLLLAQLTIIVLLPIVSGFRSVGSFRSDRNRHLGGDLGTYGDRIAVHAEEDARLRCVRQRSPCQNQRRAPSSLLAMPLWSKDVVNAAPSVAKKAEPRTGLAQTLLNMALGSPLWKYVLVPQARNTMIQTAEENGIQWIRAKAWIKRQDGPWNRRDDGSNRNDSDPSYPDYYRKPFHAYPEGNLCYEAAFEQELASRAVGARNFPAFGEGGEDAFRGAFDDALDRLGAQVTVPEAGGVTGEGETEDGKQGGVIVDFGCGTGTSSRRLAEKYPNASRIIGVDLSPYFIDVGNTLLELAPSTGNENEDGWVTDVNPDSRVELRVGDIAATDLPSDFASVVNLSLVVHELPLDAAKAVLKEAYRILIPGPGGQLWISEMDFDSTAYAAQRSNALLFSLLRATEPYLDDYADGANELRQFMAEELFDQVRIGAATGRHYALVAEGKKPATTGDETEQSNKKEIGSIQDWRFLEDGSYAVEDTHLKPWENKE